MLQQLGEFDVHLAEVADHATLFALVAQPTLLSRVWKLSSPTMRPSHFDHVFLVVK